MKILLYSALFLTIFSAAGLENLLPPVGEEWKTAHTATAQAAFKITTLNAAPAFFISNASDAGYAYYRIFPKLAPGEYTFQADAAGNTQKGMSVEIYSFDSGNKPRPLLFLNSPGGEIKATVLQKSFSVPEGSAYLRVGVGLNGKGEARFANPRIVKGKVAPVKTVQQRTEPLKDAGSENNLLPPVGPEWKTARTASAQAAFQIIKHKDRPAFHISIASDSGYAYYRAFPKLPPGEYTFLVDAEGNSQKGLSTSIYSFDSENKPRPLLFLSTPAGSITHTTLQKTFTVPEGSASLRVEVGLTSRGEATYSNPRIIKGKAAPSPKTTVVKTPPEPVTTQWLAEWIWLKNDPGLPRVDFSREITLETPPASAFVQLTADNGYVLSVNGKTVGSDVDWKNVEIYDIAPYLHKGKNTIAVNVLNYDGAAGLLLQGMIRESSGKSIPVISDGSWTISRPDEKKAELAVIGKVPTPPWGSVPFHRIIPPRFLKLQALEAITDVAPGGILKYVFPASEKALQENPESLKLRFYDANGRETPLAGLPPVIRLEKRINRLFVELPLSRFACPGSYRAEITASHCIIPAGTVRIAPAPLPGKPGAHLPGPSEFNRMKTAQWEQSLFVYATETPCPEHFRLWSRSGGHIYEISVPTGHWKSSGSFDTTQCEQTLLEILENDPNASVLLKFRIDVPGWWAAAHPDDLFHSNKNRSAQQSFCSDAWRKDAITAVGNALEELSKRPAGKAVSGVLLMGFRGGEFQLWGENVAEYDCSPVAKKALLAWWKAKKLPGEIHLPHPALEFPFQKNTPEYARIRDAFFQFTAERHAENLVYMVREFKKRFGERFAIGLYYGYGMEYAGNIQRMLFSGHLGIEKLLNEAPLNLLSCPFSYGLRGYADSHAFMNLVDSARLHNILPIGENDIRNYRTPEYSDSSGVAIFSLHDSVVNNRRMRLLGAMHGAFIRYLALHPNVDIFADPAIIRTIAEDNLLIENLKANPIGAPGQIAVVSSPITWTKIWRLPQKRASDFGGKIRDTVMRTGRDPVFLIFQDYLKICRRFQYAVIQLPGLLEAGQKTALEKHFGKLPAFTQEDGALLLRDGKWEVVKDNLKSVWEKLATQDAKRCGFGTVWYVGQNFRYTWDGKKLILR